MKLSAFAKNAGLWVILTLGSSALASAAILLDRGLPNTSGANNATFSARSNIDWGATGGFINGDSFVSGDWSITSISVWMVANPSNFNNFSLYGGIQGTNTFGIIGTSPLIAQAFYGPPNGGVACNDAINGASYSTSSGCQPIYKLTFAVNLTLTALTVYDFAANADPNDPSTCNSGTSTFTGCFFSHATNAALAGTPQQGSNNLYIKYDPTKANGNPFTIDTNASASPCMANFCGDWDKSSDINVQVTGTSVPEPSSVTLMALGLGALGLIRCRRGCGSGAAARSVATRQMN